MSSEDSQKLSSQEVVDRLKALYQDSLIYDLIEYKNAKTKIDLICVEHGKYSAFPLNLFRGQKGCQKCRYRQSAKTASDTTEEFVAKAIKIHGSRYDYSLVNYVNQDTKVEVVCSIHGSFNTIPYNHLIGNGCWKCSKNGFNITKPAILYILNDGLTVKVGITNRDITKRLREINKHSPFNFRVESLFNFENGKHALQLEGKLLKFLSSKYEPVTEVFDGSTECFIDVDLAELLSFIHPPIQSETIVSH